ncbi:MAG: HNH endonuclease signature motif containing protein [Mycobacterium sp.]
MSSIAFDEAIGICRAIDAALNKLDALDKDGLSNPERLELLERREVWRRRLPAGEHELLAELAYAPAEEIGGRLVHVLADRLRIYRRDAKRRVEEAFELGRRRALSGEPLAPRLEATAAGQRAGMIGAEQVGSIREFFAALPCFIDEPTRAEAETKLAFVAARYRPDELKRFADWYTNVLNPDGEFSDEHRARKRGITIGWQGRDGMSAIKGWLNPELRAGLDAVLAKLAAPGMGIPKDENASVEGEPDPQAVEGDDRSAAQRNHDALNVMVRHTLMSGELGSHQGLPVSIVATVELTDLQAKAGRARTGGGSWLPTTDLIRMAAHAYNFLLVFDQAKPLQLYKGRSTRLATPAQRLVLYATEAGCTRPGCDAPPYWCQTHHATKDWAAGGNTNIDDLTLACGPDNRLVTDGGWKTRKRKDGTTEWIPPPQADHGQPRTNTYWHPEKMLDNDNDNDEDEDPH